MDRRQFMAGGAGLLSGASLAQAQPAQDLQGIAREAWLYCLPVIQVASIRTTVLGRTPLNAMLYASEVANATTQLVTSPNNDTLNSRAFLDLRAGPVELVLPPSGGRYYSVALEDMYTNNFAILGARTTGPSGGRFLIVGPNEAAPSTAIRSPTPTAFLLSRTLFRNHADLEAARRFQAGILLRPRGPAAPVAPTVSPDAPWEAYFAAAGELLLENPPPATDQAFFERAAVLGLSPAGFRPRALTAAQRAQVERGVAEARAIARDPMGGMEVRGSWGYPQANLGWFDQDYVFRGQTAMVGLFALTPSEVIYTRSVGDTGRGTFHAPAYRIRFPPGGEPPVDGFWSLTLYEVAPDGRLLFTPNPMDRYSIGDRTPGLLRDRDGALELLIARKDPGQGGRTNWLPAPAERPFVLSFRCYWPRPAFRNGSYRLPEVTRA